MEQNSTEEENYRLRTAVSKMFENSHISNPLERFFAMKHTLEETLGQKLVFVATQEPMALSDDVISHNKMAPNTPTMKKLNNIECFIIHSLWWDGEKLRNSYFTRYRQENAEAFACKLISDEIEEDIREDGADSIYAETQKFLEVCDFKSANRTWQKAQENGCTPVCRIFIARVFADSQGSAGEGDYGTQGVADPNVESES